jgi:hypothetical protein
MLREPPHCGQDREIGTRRETVRKYADAVDIPVASVPEIFGGHREGGRTIWRRSRPAINPQRTLAAGLAGGILLLALLELANVWIRSRGAWFNLGDLSIYLDATTRLLTGDQWFLDRQLHGPYEIVGGDVLYPPTTALLFAPFLVLSREWFVLIPILVTAWSVWRWQPAAWTWPLMALCLLWPTTPLKVVSGNPSLWVAAAVALGLRFGWPGVFILLKPTFLPFAFIGHRRRSYWIAAAALALVSLPMLDAILVYPQVLVDSRGGGLAYSLPDWPTAFVAIGQDRLSTTDRRRDEDRACVAEVTPQCAGRRQGSHRRSGLACVGRSATAPQ